MKHLIGFFILIGFINNLYAQTNVQCSNQIFANALFDAQNQIFETDAEDTVRAWIYQTYERPDTIKQILQCPEFVNATYTETITTGPVEYVFPSERQLIINYKTSKKNLTEKLNLSEKKALPNNNPNPQIGELDTGGFWTNTDPAWYAILVVQHDSLSEFIGPDKNNTVSLKYIEQNIDSIHPRGNLCTSKSALSNDMNNINLAMHETVNIEDDTNDYYVAGDANLQWITWGQVALDATITVATMGAGTAVLGATKSARASRAAKNLVTTIKGLQDIPDVKNYNAALKRLKTASDELKKLEKLKDTKQIANKKKDIANINTEIKNLEKITDVSKYKDATKNLDDVMRLRNSLSAWRVPQRGNVIARVTKSVRASMNTSAISKAAKAGRASMKSGKTRDWLFHSTLKNIGAVSKFTRNVGMLYGVLNFVGDMYDWSATSTAEFTNNIDFKPLGLLSADDLQGQEKQVNHGMWLMWSGNSTSAADDDAAYLQSMDFAAKFAEDLNEIQSSRGDNCNVDIYVVRPVLYHHGDGNADIYYLVMNDYPWISPEQ